jgi:AMIN domain
LPALAQVSNPVPDSNGARDTPIVLSRVTVILDQGAPAVEITSNRRIVPTITTSDRPRRITVDLQNAEMSISEKRIKVHSEDIAGIRLHQFTTSPPIARLVVDLRKPLTYTVDNVGDKLILRLHVEKEEAIAKPPSIPTLTKSLEPVAVPVSPASYGNVVSADRLVSGASVTAGHDTMLLRLPRGGEIYVCPSTSVSITSAPNGADLMIAMSTGALETHYALEHSTDAIMTPDFRILLRGPGEFHYAISADSRGDTCMRGLPGNTATAVVSELMGEGVYEVEPDDKIVFHMGRVSATDTALHSGSTHIIETALPQDCGCPPPRAPELIASNGANPNLQGTMRLAQPDDWQKKESATSQSALESKIGDSASPANAGPETAALPALKADEPHVMISAPIVFNAPAIASPPPVEDSRDLPIVSAGRFASIQPEVSPPVSSEPIGAKPHRGLGARLKHVLKAIFR